MTGLTPRLTYSYPPYRTRTGFHSGLRVAVSADGGGTSGSMGAETKKKLTSGLPASHPTMAFLL